MPTLFRRRGGRFFFHDRRQRGLRSVGLGRVGFSRATALEELALGRIVDKTLATRTEEAADDLRLFRLRLFLTRTTGQQRLEHFPDHAVAVLHVRWQRRATSLKSILFHAL